MKSHRTTTAAEANRKKGYVTTAERRVINPDERKGSEKRAERDRPAWPDGSYIDLRKESDASV